MTVSCACSIATRASSYASIGSTAQAAIAPTRRIAPRVPNPVCSSSCAAACDLGSGKSHLAQALGHAAIQQGYQVRYREAFVLLEELADARLDVNRRWVCAGIGVEN